MFYAGLVLIRFNPSRGIAIIQTGPRWNARAIATKFQSLTRDSNHSNRHRRAGHRQGVGFNPSRGIAIIQTRRFADARRAGNDVSIPHAG